MLGLLCILYILGQTASANYEDTREAQSPQSLLFDKEAFSETLKKLGWDRVEEYKANSRIFLLCQESDCRHMLKFLRPEHSSEAEVQKFLQIQIDLAEKHLAPKILYIGEKIPRHSEEREFFFISEFGTQYESCPEPRASKADMIRALAKEGLVHNDLEYDFANMVCINETIMAIDFDFSEELSSLEPEEKFYKIELEKFCTLNKTMSPENMKRLPERDRVSFQMSALLKLPNASLNVCTCRKAKRSKVLMDYLKSHLPNYSCD